MTSESTTCKKNGNQKGYRKIIVALDGSKAANKALETAITFHDLFKSEIVAFHSVEVSRIPQVSPMPFPFNPTASYTMPTTDYNRIKEELMAAGQRVLDEAKEMLEKAGVGADLRLVDNIDPADFVIERVEEEGFDLVIAGCKGDHSRIERALLGTVAQKLLNEANCDVLITKIKEE